MKLLLAVLALALAGCAGVEVKTTDPATGATTTTIDFTKAQLAVDIHNGEVAAAKYATDHGLPERAAVRTAIDSLLTAWEQQKSACANAIKSMLDSVKPPAVKDENPILVAEIAEEAVGSFSGVPAKVKMLCAAVPIPTLPVFPKIPLP